MKTLPADRLDRDTPKWPEVRITLGDNPTVTVSGVETPTDDEATALARTAAQARTLGRPIRARVTTAAGALHRLIVSTDGTVTEIGGTSPVRATKAPPTAAAVDAQPAKKRSAAGILGRFPAPLRPVLKWGTPVFGVLVLASAGVLAFHGDGDADAPTAPPIASVPPAGQLYTELPPPGWSDQATWVVDLAEDAPAPVVASDGTVVAVTAQDRSAIPATGDDRYLSVLESDGRTRWAVPLDRPPRLGPVILTVDGAPIVMVADTKEITYWPLAGGPETVVDLPSGATVTPTGLVEFRDGRLGYLHADALTTVQSLPRTYPAIAVDGAVLVTQPDTGAWWALRAGQAPTPVRPAAPKGATTVQRVLALTANHAVVAWNTNDTRTCRVAVYTHGDSTPTGSAAAPCNTLPREGAAAPSNGALAGVGPVVINGSTVTVVQGLAITAAFDQVYGTIAGDPVTITPDGHTTALPAGTLTPVGSTAGHLLVVGAPNRLYALQKS